MGSTEFTHPSLAWVKKRPAKQLNVSAKIADANRNIKLCIWAYFFLLIFEGALRKWVLPGLATPLLVIRDPVVLLALFLAISKGLLAPNKYLIGMVVIGLFGLMTAMVVGHKNFAVAIFGARILLLHFPFIFVMGKVFSRDDVLKMGKMIVYMSIPMVILIAIQFYSPQSAWVNRGVGDDIEGAGFTGALGYFRPPGTFSFTNGTTLFFGLAAGFIVYFWLNLKQIKRVVLIAATGALLASIPLSISRALLFQVVLTGMFAIMASSRKPEYLGRMIMASLGILIALVLLSQASFFQTATEAFSSRFDAANETEGGLEGVFLDRYLGGMIGAIDKSSEEPFFGYGIGMGTNVGAMLLGGEVTFLISEGEWGRLIGELGPLLGIAVILIRLGFSFKILQAAYKKLTLGELLPWMLLAYCLTTIPQGQWAQPTSLGFSTLIGGLILSSLRVTGRFKKKVKVQTKANPQTLPSKLAPDVSLGAGKRNSNRSK